MKNITRKALLAGAALTLNVKSMFAQIDLTQASQQMESALQDIIDPLFKILSWILGIVGAVMLIWAYLKRSKSDQQSSDAMINWGWGLVVAVIGLQIVKAVFFPGV